ncbi:MAG: hypothetical protein ACYTG5_18625 [Planctomycetota bacterium]|jgi:hypothetical protein
MKNQSKNETSGAAHPRFHHWLAASALMGSLLAQTQYQGQPYGQPSEWQQGTDATLSLSLTELESGMSALRLEGGQPGHPAYLVFANGREESEMQGATLLISDATGTQAGTFDHAGVYLYLLTEAQFGGRDELFVQGMAPTLYPAGAELSAGLMLSEKPENEEPGCGGAMPPEEILVEEFGELMLAGYLESAMELALNSKGDSLEIKISGALEVPVYPGITAGGKAAFKAGIQRAANGDGAVVYDMGIGADVAASAGVGIGVAGAGLSAGAGYDAKWRYESTHEVARAIRSMIILQGVGPRIEGASLLLHDKLAIIDRGIANARRMVDWVRSKVRRWLPWRNNPLVRHWQRVMDNLRAERRRVANEARGIIGKVIGFIAEERIFITEHIHGYEIRSAVAGDVSVGGKVNKVELSASVTAERKFALQAEFVRESDAIAFEQKISFTTKAKAAAKFGLGAEVSGGRVIELSTKMQVGTDGFHEEESGTTVKITLDRALALSLGVTVIEMEGAVAGEVSAELRLEDLLDYSQEAIAILTGDDDLKFAELLLAFPVKFEARANYSAKMGLGVDFKVKGLGKFKLGAEMQFTDWSESLVYQGGETGHELLELMRQVKAIAESDAFRQQLEDVSAEVQAIMN